MMHGQTKIKLLLNYYYYYYYYHYHYLIKLFILCLRHMLPDIMKFVVKTVKDSFNFVRD